MALNNQWQQKNLLSIAEMLFYLLINWQAVCVNNAMLPYKNVTENAGVSSYEIGDDFIIAEFQDGSTYLYNYQSTGKANIEQMKTLALTGKGLTTFINQHIREHYAKKLQ